MVSRDLSEVLTILYEAGAMNVPAREIGWTEPMGPSVLHATNMQYVAWRSSADGRVYSLTESGYKAIGAKPPSRLPIGRAVRSMFRWIGGDGY